MRVCPEIVALKKALAPHYVFFENRHRDVTEVLAIAPVCDDKGRLKVFWNVTKKRYQISLALTTEWFRPHAIQCTSHYLPFEVRATTVESAVASVHNRLMTSPNIDIFVKAWDEAVDNFRMIEAEEAARKTIENVYHNFFDNCPNLYAFHHEIRCGNYQNKLKFLRFLAKNKGELEEWMNSEEENT